MNKMMQQNHSYNHRNQLHSPPEGGGAATMQGTHSGFFVFFFLIICTKPKMPLGLYNNNKQTMMKLQSCPLSQC
jgi:hypothetical protein